MTMATPAATPPTADVLGLPLHIVDMDEAVGRIARFIAEGGFHLVITLGTEMVMNARHDAAFRDVARQAHLLVPDSIGVVWAARRQGFKGLHRVAGIELLDRLSARAAAEGWRLFLLGGKPGVAEEAAARLIERHPGLQLAGIRDGYFKDDEAVVREIRESKADLVLVAMGSPRQEAWSWRHGEALGAAVAMGVGGSFDVLAGRTPRAPMWMRRLHLEWLFRLYLEPRRAGRMLALPHFAIRVLLEGRRQ